MNFCGSCGASLHPTPVPRRERRLVSVLFCDLVGFTTFSETRDPEDVRDVLGEYFAAARRIVGDYGGTIEKFIGDAVMALWGAPIAREDDAARAVRAGLEIVQAVMALAQRLSIPALRVRVGVLTGEAAVEVGSQEEGMVTGDAVNTAARIQSIADPETVLVDDVTRLACERVIAFDDAGLHSVKGRRAPVQVWRAVRIRDDADMPGSAAIVPPLVGRDQQLDTVAGAVRGLLGTDAGVQIGEAGIGKSRLSWELEQRDARYLTVGWHRGRSLAFGEGNGLSALAEFVRGALGIGPADTREWREARVEETLQQWFAHDPGERPRIGKALRRLLGLDDGQEVIEQGELFSAWRVLLERLAEERPIVLVFEEVQLADQALLDFIGHLREWGTGARILVFVLSRPDPRLTELSGAGERIELQPLSDAEMDELVAGTVAGAPEALLAAIRADGGGVPLYAVETLRTLADQGVLMNDGVRYVVRGTFGRVSVPPTIRALVSSRLDRLDSDERQVLLAGAVLGERFTSGGAAAVADMSDEATRRLLDGLVAKAFLEVEADADSTAGRYAFVQGVVRQVTVARASRRELKRRHLAAVEHLLALTETEPELATALAGHLVAAVEADPRASDVATATTRYRAAQDLHPAAGRTREHVRLRAKEMRAVCYARPPAQLLPQAQHLYAELGEESDAVKALAVASLCNLRSIRSRRRWLPCASRVR